MLPPRIIDHGRGKTLFSASHTGCPGSLTLETALALPVFLCVCLNIAWYLNVYRDAARLSSAMAQTAQEMALGAFILEDEDAQSVPGNILSIAYAGARTRSLAGSTRSLDNLNFLMSGICDEDQMINITAAWQVRAPLGYLKIPFHYYVQTARARAWTGYGSPGGDEEESDDGEEMSRTVYVTATGAVYHTDENCSHLKLSVRKVDYDSLENRRNQYGAKYHACEYCGGGVSGGSVFITSQGNRYHSDRNCRGLKRTVSKKKLEEVENLRPCSKCSGG